MNKYQSIADWLEVSTKMDIIFGESCSMDTILGGRSMSGETTPFRDGNGTST